MVFRFPGSVSLSSGASDLGINPFSSADHEIGGENQRGEGTRREGCIPLVVAVFRKENSFKGGERETCHDIAYHGWRLQSVRYDIITAPTGYSDTGLIDTPVTETVFGPNWRLFTSISKEWPVQW